MRSVPDCLRAETIVANAFRESIANVRRLIDQTNDPAEIARYRAVLATFPKEMTSVC